MLINRGGPGFLKDAVLKRQIALHRRLLLNGRRRETGRQVGNQPARSLPCRDRGSIGLDGPFVAGDHAAKIDPWAAGAFRIQGGETAAFSRLSPWLIGLDNHQA